MTIVVTEQIDLGHDHTLRFVSWAPDRDLNPQYDGIPDVERYGAVISHPAPPGYRGAGDLCEGSIIFDGEVQRRLDPHRPRWTVESWQPLTLSPSLQCHCGDHGHVRGGVWVPA